MEGTYGHAVLSPGPVYTPTAVRRLHDAELMTRAEQREEFSLENEDFPALPSARTPSEKGQGSSSTQPNPPIVLDENAFPPLSSHGSLHPVTHRDQSGMGGSIHDITHSSSLTMSTSSKHGPQIVQPAQPSYPPNIQMLSSSGLQGYISGRNAPSASQRLNSSSSSARSSSPSSPGISSTGDLFTELPPEDFYSLRGLVRILRTAEVDLSALTLGFDLTTLGLNLNQPESLYSTFSSPWSESPSSSTPEFRLPDCYRVEAPALTPDHFSRFQLSTLMYIFYSMPRDVLQVAASRELKKRGWQFHKERQLWFRLAQSNEPLFRTEEYERGSYIFFNVHSWEEVRKDSFTLHFSDVQDIP